METIIIFTDWDSIYQNQPFFELSWVPNEYPIMFIKVSDAKSILVVYDQINNGQINLLIDKIINESEVYILHHNNPTTDFLDSLNVKLKSKNCKIKPLEKHHYDNEYRKIQEIDRYGVIEITKDLQELEKVFDELKAMLSGNLKLNTALEFLHRCLGHTPTKDDQSKLTKAGFDLEKNETGKTSINKLIQKLSNGGDYNAALRDVRDALLENAN